MNSMTRTWTKSRHFIGGTVRALGEMLGVQRAVRRFAWFASLLSATRDVGTASYEYWDKARRGRAQGLEISGLLLKPLQSKIASWVMGRAPSFKLDNENAAEALNTWWGKNLAKILTAYEDAIGLGDSYLVINPDLTVVAIPPTAIRPLVDDSDYSRIIGWRIEEKYPHPTEPGRAMRIRDDYTATHRVRTVWIDNAPVSHQTYPNFIGLIPVIHIANHRSADELFGRPEGDALTTLLHRYGEALDAALEGNVRQGRPTPVISRMGDAQAVEAFWNQFAKTRVHELADGTTETETYVEFDADQLLTLGGEATFDWKSPGPFSADTQVLLGLLFYLYLEHVELPEWVLGNAIASSRASAETQVEPLVKFIEKKRTRAEDWMLALCRVVLAYLGVSEAAVRIADDDDIQIIWDDLTTKDGSLTLSTLEWALDKGLIRKETAVRLMPVEIENPAEEVELADQEAEDQRDAFDAGVDRAIADAERRAEEAEARLAADDDADETAKQAA